MQPDIEIYVLSCPIDNIIAWLEKEFSLLNNTALSPQCSKLILRPKNSNNQNSDIEVTILEQAAGKRFTSIWFDSNKTPWKDDIDCAKHVFATLGCEVRCNYHGWQEDGDQDPDQWWRINSHGEGPFVWN